MFSIYADGQAVYDPAQTGDECMRVFGKSMQIEAGCAGSLSFTLPVGHRMYDSIAKMKSTITAYQNGKQVFRGRVLQVERDYYGQKTFECEGDLCYLMDSVQKPAKLNGTMTEIMNALICTHNAQVETKKQFTTGIVQIDLAPREKQKDEADFEIEKYTSTMDAFKQLTEKHRGYLRTRMDGDTYYLDLVGYTGENCTQRIEYGVNLLDLTETVTGDEIFTALVPVGEDNDGKEFTVESMNDGSDTIQDDAAIAKYGRIVRHYSFGYTSSAEKLLEKGRLYLQKNIESITSIQIRAVDMNLMHAETEELSVYDAIHVVSALHGIDRAMMCTRIEYNMDDPSQTMYTLGTPPKTMTDIEAETKKKVGGGGGGGGLEEKVEEAKKLIYYAKLDVDNNKAFIQAVAGVQDLREWEEEGKTNVKEVSVVLDGAKNEIASHAEQLVTQAHMIDSHETWIKQTADKIMLEAIKQNASASIELTGDGVTISGGKITLDGTVISKLIEGYLANFHDISCDMLFVDGDINAGSVNGCDIMQSTLTIGGKSCAFIAPEDATFELSDMPGYADALAAATNEGIASVTLGTIGDISYSKTTKVITFTIGRNVGGSEAERKTYTVSAGEAYNDGVQNGSASDEELKAAHNAGGATAKLSRGSAYLGYGETATVTAQYVDADGNTVSTDNKASFVAPAKITLQRDNIKCTNTAPNTFYVVCDLSDGTRVTKTFSINVGQ